VIPVPLEAMLAAALDALARGVADRRSPMHTPSLATIARDGAPSVRTVVLRAVDPAARAVFIHTDRRSPKVAELAADPRAMLQAYDAPARMQIRLAGHATLHHDDAIADAAWAASRETSRMTYATGHPPGTPLPEPPAAPRDAEAGRAHFAVVALHVHTLDCLVLEGAGHRRARFTWGAVGTPAATWLAP
jgi:general stress protein 26